MLVTCATFNYIDMLSLLLASHGASNPDVPLAVHAIGWPPTHLDAARSLYPHATFHAHDELTSDSPLEMKGPVPRSAEILRMKVRLLHDSYRQGTKPVIWVDADTLLLASLKPMLQRISRDGDFAVTYRARKREHARFAVAVLCFMKTDRAARLLDFYADIAQRTEGTTKRKSDDKVAWFHDQLALWQSYRQLSRGLLGLPKRDAPVLVELSAAEHSIDGSLDAVFVSRRDQVLEQSDMVAALKARNIAVHDIAVCAEKAGRSS